MVTIHVIIDIASCMVGLLMIDGAGVVAVVEVEGVDGRGDVRIGMICIAARAAIDCARTLGNIARRRRWHERLKGRTRFRRQQVRPFRFVEVIL